MSRVLDRAEHRGLRRLHRAPRPQRHGRREPHHVRRARRREPLRRRAADLRRDLAGLQHLRRQQPLHSARSPARPANPTAYKAAYKVSYNRPFNTAEDDSGRSWLFTRRRVPDDPLPRGATATTSATSSSVDVAPAAGAAAEPQAVHLQRPRRVLVGDAAHQRRGRARRRRQPRLLHRQRDVLEDALGAERRRDRARRTARSSPTRTRTSTEQPGPGRVDRHLARPALHDAGGERHAGERADRPVLPRQLGHVAASRCPYAYGQLRMWRNTAAAIADLRAEPAARARARSATSGTRTPTTASARRASSGCPRRPSAASRCSPTTAARPSSTATATHNLTMYTRAERRARVRRGHRAVGLGPRRLEPRRQRRRPQHAAGDASTCSPTWARSPSTHPAGPGRRAPRRPTPPRRPSTITAPPATVADGTQVTITGTASDTGGGVVAGIEVSTDGGTTWHPATGTTSWTYTWTAHGNPSTTIKVARRPTTAATSRRRAPASRSTSTAPARCGARTSVHRRTARLRRPDARSRSGVKFKSDSFGTVSGVRFYKAAANTGTHIGSLWSAERRARSPRRPSPARRAPAGRPSRSPRRSRCTPGTTYVASYYAPNGHYAATADYFYRNPAPGPERRRDRRQRAAARASATPARTTNGVYTLQRRRARSRSTRFGAANYWVDVVFSPIPAPGQRHQRQRRRAAAARRPT